MACNYGSGPKWVKGVITKHLGPVTVLVHTSSTRQIWKWHHNQLRTLNTPSSTTKSCVNDDVLARTPPSTSSTIEPVSQDKVSLG